MLEAYLFIDPLCKKCIKSEQIIKKLARNLNIRFSYQIIPMLNLKIIHRKRSRSDSQHNYQLYYDTVMDYKAALFQGQKRGQNFFIMLQNELLNDNHPYNNRLVMSTAENAKLDLDMFKEDRRSRLARKAFKSDQQLVNEMKISKPSSAVIFNCDTFNYGLLFNRISYPELYQICHRRYRTNQLLDNHGIPVPNVHIF